MDATKQLNECQLGRVLYSLNAHHITSHQITWCIRFKRFMWWIDLSPSQPPFYFFILFHFPSFPFLFVIVFAFRIGMFDGISLFFLLFLLFDFQHSTPDFCQNENTSALDLQSFMGFSVIYRNVGLYLPFSVMVPWAFEFWVSAYSHFYTVLCHLLMCKVGFIETASFRYVSHNILFRCWTFCVFVSILFNVCLGIHKFWINIRLICIPT